MKQVNFIGPGYTLPSPQVDIQRCLNFLLERHELGGGKNQERFYLRSRPKLTLLSTMGSGPTRGGFAAENGRSFAVSGNTLYEITTPASPSSLGTLSTSTGRVWYAGNTTQLLIVDGTAGYILTYATDALATVSDVDFLSNPTMCAFLDQYIIAINGQDGQFHYSALSDATDWNGLDFATAEGAPDNTKALLVDHRQVILFGDLTIEIWVNDGATPFSRMAGAFIEHGITAPYTAAKIDNTVFWVGKDANGQGIVWRLGDGFAIERISTFAVEYAIAKYGSISAATGFTFQYGGHSCYALNFPGSTVTWVYDIAIGAWYEWDYSKPSGGSDRFRGDWHIFAGSKHIVGDYENGNLYELQDPYVISGTAYTDNGAVIARERVSPIISADGKWLYQSEAEIDLDKGAGPPILREDPATGNQVEQPLMVMLSYTKEDMRTWSNEKMASAGKVGESPRVRWHQLGRFRNRAYKVRITDPLPVTLISGLGEVTQ